jgi:Acetyltransferase (GNAT) domain
MNHVTLTSFPDDSTAAAWNDCLDNSEFAGFYTAPEYFRVQYFQHARPFAVLAVAGDVVHGVATGLVGDRDIVCGNSGGPQVCIRRGSHTEGVGTALATGLRSVSIKSTKFISAFAWNETAGFQSLGFRAKTMHAPLGTILLDLSKGTDRLFRDCAEDRRYNIRRAIKAGVEVMEMNIRRDFDEYYTLYKHWCESKRLSPHPYELQRAVFETKGNRLLLVARHNGRMVGASTLRFRRQGVIECSANVSRREETKLKQNDLLMWRAIEWSVQQKDIRYFSTGAAHAFLQRFGGHRHATYRYSLDLTAFRVRHLAETGREVAARVYQALPQRARQGIRKLLRYAGDRAQ